VAKNTGVRSSKPAPTRAELVSLYEKPLSVREIALLLNRHPQTVFSWFNAKDIPLRGRTEAVRLDRTKHPGKMSLFTTGGIKTRFNHEKWTPEKKAQFTEKLRLAGRGKGCYHLSPEHRAKISRTNSDGRRKWTPEQRERLLPGFLKRTRMRPTSIEKIFNSLIEKHHLPYKYVGDGYTWIAGRCPDYLNINGKKEVVEVFSRWWHDPAVNPRVKPQHLFDATLAHYAKYGFNCIIIWEEELQNESAVLEKLQKGA